MIPEDCQIHQAEITEMGRGDGMATGLLLGVAMALLTGALMYSFFS